MSRGPDSVPPPLTVDAPYRAPGIESRLVESEKGKDWAAGISTARGAWGEANVDWLVARSRFGLRYINQALDEWGWREARQLARQARPGQWVVLMSSPTVRELTDDEPVPPQRVLAILDKTASNVVASVSESSWLNATHHPAILPEIEW